MARASTQRQPEPANDTPATNEPDTQAVTALQLSKIIRSADSLASANGAHRNALKNAEAKGLHLKAAKLALQVRKSEDPDAFTVMLHKALEYLTILGVGIGREQLDLFPTAPDTRTPLDERAYLDGLRAGRLAEGTDENPHHPGVEAHQRWMEGFNQGTADRNLLLSLEAETQAELIEGAGHDDGDLDDEEGDD